MTERPQQLTQEAAAHIIKGPARRDLGYEMPLHGVGTGVSQDKLVNTAVRGSKDPLINPTVTADSITRLTEVVERIKAPVAPAAEVPVWKPDLNALQLDSPHGVPQTGGVTLAGNRAPKIA